MSLCSTFRFSVENGFFLLPQQRAPYSPAYCVGLRWGGTEVNGSRGKPVSHFHPWADFYSSMLMITPNYLEIKSNICWEEMTQWCSFPLLSSSSMGHIPTSLTMSSISDLDIRCPMPMLWRMCSMPSADTAGTSRSRREEFAAHAALTTSFRKRLGNSCE